MPLTCSKLLINIWCWLLASSGQQQPWAPYVGIPPLDIAPAEATYGKLLYPQSETRGLGWFNLPEKKVTIRWSHSNPDANKLQSIATSYWPTSIVALKSGNELVIGGKRKNGYTVIEVWKIKKPLLMSPYPPGSGNATFQDAIVESVDTIYDAAVQRRDMVAWMMPKPNEPSGLLIQFYDSHDVYDMDFSSDPPILTQVAAASALPPLSRDFTFCWSRDHRTRGFVYVLRDEDTADSTLVFIDQNRDHVVDSVMTVTDAAWVSGDWADLSNYN